MTVPQTKLIMANLQTVCKTELPVLRQIAEDMADAMRAGLAEDEGGSTSDLKMILTYVNTLPTGNETGLFYALDLGGTNFRVIRMQLGGKNVGIIDTDELEGEKKVPEKLMMSGTSEELFDFMASRLATLVQKECGKFSPPPHGTKREIGFTFSFPVKQQSIDSGILIKWTKMFDVSDTVGRDVVVCLQEAIERQRLDMRVSVLVNDTVGTLAAARYSDQDVKVAVILGTGTNACYVERMDAIPKLQGQGSGITIINMEWGAFSKNLPLTDFDKEMDAASINPGEQIFEKTISGMYLGEIVRRVLLKMAETEALFGESVPEKLNTPFLLSTRHLCYMQKDDSDDLRKVGSKLSKIFGVTSNIDTRKIVVEVCDTIVKRAGRLAGAGIVGILLKMEQDTKGLILGSGKRTVVAVDGSLYENYPQYQEYVKDAITELLGSEIWNNVFLEHSKDGSGKGAALLAAANSKYI